MKLICLSLCLLVTLPSLATASDAPTRPAWVDGKTSDQYPDTKYLTAVGSGSSREAATENAKRAVASSFRQNVKSETNSDEKSNLTESTNASVSGEAKSSSQSSVQITSNVELRGVEVKEFWEDPATHDKYALAVLDKLKVRNSYLMDLNRMKEHLLSIYDSFKTKPTQKGGHDVLDRAQEYSDLEKEANMVGTPTGAIQPITAKELEGIRQKLEELKSSKPVALNITAETGSSAEEASDLQEILAGCLQDKGYSITEGKDAVATLNGTYRAKSKHLKVEGFLSFEFSVKAAVKKASHTDRKLLSKTSNGREQDQAFDTVKQELSDSLCSLLVQDL